MSNLHGFDIAVITAYFLVLAGIGYWAARREKNVSADFFLASRDVGWFAVGASLFASNIGSEHLVGLAGTGAASGLAVGHFEWLACFMLLLLGWLFVPFYLRSGVYTMPEFLERRFNPAARSYFTWVSIIGYVLTKISVTLFAGGIVMREVTGYSVWTSAVILIVVTGIYTVLGGLRAVIYTEVMQAVVLIIGSATMTVLGLQAVGGWSGLEARVPADFFSMWKPMNHPNFPWTGIVFGAPILGVWYWCTDQHIVQRVLAAKNVSAARTGTIFAGFLKILPVFIFVLPGIIAAALYADIRGGSADAAYPALVTRLLPAGFKGLVLAGMLAPPIAACFLLGVLYPRLNGTGALAALWTGLVIGTARLVLELARSDLASGTVWYWFATINFLHFAALLFALCSGILIAVSLATDPPGAARTVGLTYGAPEITAVPISAGPRQLNIVLSVVLAATIGVLWIVFR